MVGSRDRRRRDRRISDVRSGRRRPAKRAAQARRRRRHIGCSQRGDPRLGGSVSGYPYGMDLTKHKPFSGFSVDDSDTAYSFYSDKLGLEVDRHGEMLWIHTHGEEGVLAYPKGAAHQPASFTIL